MGLIVLVTRHPELSAILNWTLCEDNGYWPPFWQLTSSTESGGFALLPGDASVDSWFREIHVPRSWRVYLATGFDFREKKRACFGSIGVPTLASVSYLVTIL